MSDESTPPPPPRPPRPDVDKVFKRLTEGDEKAEPRDDDSHSG